MDYEGKFFPDEEEENLTEKQKRRKKALRYTFFGIVILVYIVAFAVLFTNCDASLYNEYYFSESARAIYNKDPDNFEVYNVFPQTFMNYDGSVQLDGVIYTPTANELEFGIKYNRNLIGEDGAKPTFKLVDTNGNEYGICFIKSEEKGRYVYNRVSFENVRIELNDNVYINPNISADVEGEGSEYDTYKMSLSISYTDGTTEEITVYNSKTAMQITNDYKG